MAYEEGYLNDSDWFKHSCHPTGDKRFNKLVSRYGAEGYAVFFSALEVIYSGTLDDEEIEGISDTLNITIERVVEILSFCKKECRGLLYQTEDGSWSSNRAEIELERRKDKKARRQIVNHEYWLRKKAENQDEIRESKTVLDGLRESKTIQSLSKTPIRVRERERVREEYVEESKKLKFFTKEEGGEEVPQTPPKPKKSSAFVSLNPPTLEEVKAYGSTISLPFSQTDAESFYDHFVSNGWKVGGKAPMKDWKAAVRNWARNGATRGDSRLTARKTHLEPNEQELVGVEWGEL